MLQGADQAKLGNSILPEIKDSQKEQQGDSKHESQSQKSYQYLRHLRKNTQLVGEEKFKPYKFGMPGHQTEVHRNEEKISKGFYMKPLEPLQSKDIIPEPIIQKKETLIRKKVRKSLERKTAANIEQEYKCSKHDTKEAIFYCLKEKVFLCDSCFDTHKDHQEMADSIKNHLASQFTQWRQLMEHSKINTKKQIDTNLQNHKDIISYLKRTTKRAPEIDAITLSVIYNNFVKRLSEKINVIKELCKKGDLLEALNMRQDMQAFKQQLQELEERSQVTAILYNYIKMVPIDEQQPVYNGLPIEKQFFLLRKQYDQRMKQLSLIAVGQRQRIDRYQNFLDFTETHAENEAATKVDFESQFN